MRLDLTQAALARAAQVDPGELARIESGERKAPSFLTVCRIAAALGISLDALATKAGLRKDRNLRTGRWNAPAGSLDSLRALQAALHRAIAHADVLRKRLSP
jgi:transcriptional regulator with XRE-family HTH domain